MKLIRIGTRNSTLALWQANEVKKKIEQIGYKTQIVNINSFGDKNTIVPIYTLGIQGVFTKELDTALLNSKVDIAVHSLKDVPTTIAKELTIGAVLCRANPYDAIINPNNIDLDNNNSKIVATGSLRRKAQWLNKFANDSFVDLRGSIETRIEKIKNQKNIDIGILSCAAIERLEIKDANIQVLNWMLPAPSQGAIGISARVKDFEILEILANINDENAFDATKIEREFLAYLKGGCSLPISAYCQLEDNKVNFKASVLSIDGKEKIEIEENFEFIKNVDFGKQMGMLILKHGADKILEKYI